MVIAHILKDDKATQMLQGLHDAETRNREEELYWCWGVARSPWPKEVQELATATVLHGFLNEFNNGALTMRFGLAVEAECSWKNSSYILAYSTKLFLLNITNKTT